MTKLERMTEKLQATVAGQTDDPEHLLDVLIAAWEEMHREAKEMREVLDRHGLATRRDEAGRLSLIYSLEPARKVAVGA